MRSLTLDPGNTAPAADHPCQACPWLTKNHGKRHPDGWYTKANRRRLWAGLRQGEMMSCHATDPSNPVPTGRQPVPADTTTRECAGAHVLLQREVSTINALVAANDDPAAGWSAYYSARRRGLTRIGALRYMVRGTALSEGSTHRPTPQDLDTAVSLGDDALPWPT